MSLLNWFSPRKKHQEPLHSLLPSSGLSRLDSTKPFNSARQNGTAQPANRKQERMAHRELLYAVVRESMVRAGVLSSSYKFKVLSLDTRGRQFMVMVDLAQGASRDTSRLAEIEAMIAQSAKARYGILVTAVYWRANEHVAVGDPVPVHPAAAQRAARGPASRPAPLEPAVSEPMPLSEQVSRPAELRAAPVQKFEPLRADEVAAFKKALDAGVRGEQALAAVNGGNAAHNYTLLTGFEDTEMADGDGAGQQLSATQYGALR